MSQNAKPKRAFIAYCVLAEKLKKTPGSGVMHALTPFLAEACQDFANELFNAEQFSNAVFDRYGIRIPRLAVLGLAEQLANEGLLTDISEKTGAAIYRYTQTPELLDTSAPSPVTEAEVEAVLASFIEYCRADAYLNALDDQALQTAFLDRLLNADTMRILTRRESSIAAKKTASTLVLKKPAESSEKQDGVALHLDFMVSQFLIDLRTNNPVGIEQVSNVAFANMAAEAIACFREPPEEGESLSALTVYLDSPLLLDMLGVNEEYSDYGRELLEAIKASDAIPAVFDHCIDEAESAIHAQLMHSRSGIHKLSAGWGTSVKPDLLSALSGNVAERAEKRLGIAIHRDPDAQLHRRAQSVVGDIQASMNARMQAWRKEDAKEYDQKSVWAMLSIRDTTQTCSRICDSRWILLTRNTPLVSIANDEWRTWLKGTTKHSSAHIDRWAPVAMSDKQFAGYLWARTGGGNGSISRARLLAHCSSAIRPRADIKAQAYNLVLELGGREEADDIAALLEDREGAKALMRATKGDPEDVTKERLPYILEKVRMAAGEFATAQVREEAEQQLKDAQLKHQQDLDRMQREAAATQSELDNKHRQAQSLLIQKDMEQQALEAKNTSLQKELDEQRALDAERRTTILQDGLAAGVSLYSRLRWGMAILFATASGLVGQISTDEPLIATGLTVLLGIAGFWFVPEYLDKPLSLICRRRLLSVVEAKDGSIQIPKHLPNFKDGTWLEVSRKN